MLDTPNCRVKPTALSARIADVTSPKPIARTSWFMRGRLSHATACGSAVQRRAGNDRDRVHRLVRWVVGVVGEFPLRTVVLVEGERAAGAHVLDLLAGLECLEPLRVAVHLHGTWRRGG